jgi:hypothetical protein
MGNWLQVWNQQQTPKPVMNVDTRARLAETYAPHNDRVSGILGRDLDGDA